MADAEPSTSFNTESARDDQTPSLLSPPRSKTPPVVTGKRSHSLVTTEADKSRAGSRPVSAKALSKALQHIDREPGRRASTPSASPSRKRQKVFGGDSRFIPNRSGQDLQASYNLLDDEGSPASPSRANKFATSTDMDTQRRDANRQYSSLLRSEMFDNEVPQSIAQSRRAQHDRRLLL